MEKWKVNKGKIFISSVVILLPVLIGIVLWKRLPNEMVTTFGTNGEPTGWSSKPFAVFGIPIFILICHLICCAATCTDPKNNRISRKVFSLIMWICPIVSIFCTWTTYGYALGMNIHIESSGPILMGILFIVIGNYLPKCRQNYTVGIKLPWTLYDEENWDRTHRLAGRLWMIGGGIFLLLSFVKGDLLAWLIIGVLAVLAIVPVIYSFLYYLKTTN